MQWISKPGKPLGWRGPWIDWFAWYPVFLCRGYGNEMRYAFFWLTYLRRRREQTWSRGLIWEYEWVTQEKPYVPISDRDYINSNSSRL